MNSSNVMIPDNKTLEQWHTETQASCDRVLGFILLVVQMARETGTALQGWKATLPKDSDVQTAADAAFTPELAEWVERYLAVSQLTYAERINETKPRVLQEAMRLLDIYPSIITAKETKDAP